METIGTTLSGCKVVENKINKKLFKISKKTFCGFKWWEAREVKLDKRFKNSKDNITLQNHQGTAVIETDKLQKNLIKQLNKLN